MKTFYVSLACFFCFLSSAWGVESPQIRSGETITGTIESASSSDNWYFYGEAGDRVVACAMKTSGSMPGAYIKLYDKDASIEGQNNGDPGIDLQLKKTGLYTLSVEAVAHSGTGIYSLTFQKIPGRSPAPGDLDGGTMTPGIEYTGNIDDVSDFDAYQFYGQTGDIVKVYAEKTSGDMTDLYITLYPPDGAAAESENLGSYGIDHMLAKTGLYTAVVAANNHSGTGKYDIVFLKTPSNIRPGIYNQVPDNGDVVTDDDGSLSWDPLTGATGYDVFFGEDSNRTTRYDRGQSVCSFTPPPADGRREYLLLARCGPYFNGRYKRSLCMVSVSKGYYSPHRRILNRDTGNQSGIVKLVRVH